MLKKFKKQRRPCIDDQPVIEKAGLPDDMNVFRLWTNYGFLWKYTRAPPKREKWIPISPSVWSRTAILFIIYPSLGSGSGNPVHREGLTL